MATVKLTHPKSKRTITVRDDMKGPYLSQGWVEQAAKKSTTKSKAKTDQQTDQQ